MPGVPAIPPIPAIEAQLDREGYVLFPGLVGSEWLDELRAGFDGASRGPDGGTRHVDGWIGGGPSLDRIHQHPQILAAVQHVLRRPFRVVQFSGREPLAGFGQQGLHTDARPRARSEPFGVVTSIWMLDDFTKDNGATRIVPRTHLLAKPPPKSLADPGAHHRDEIIVVGTAGTVLLFNGHLWHSGTRNRSGARRRALQLLFAAQDVPWHVAEPEGGSVT